MRSNNKKILGAVAVAGLVAATGSAFTGTGLSTTGTAGAAQFVGGTVTQSVTGATLSEIRYSFSDAPANTTANAAKLTFDSNAVNKPVTIVLNGNDTSATCENVTGVDTDEVVGVDAYVSNCTFAGISVSTIDVTVGGSTVS